MMSEMFGILSDLLCDVDSCLLKLEFVVLLIMISVHVVCRVVPWCTLFACRAIRTIGWPVPSSWRAGRW